MPAEEAKELEQIIVVTGGNDLSTNTENMKSDNKCQVRIESDNLQVSALLDLAQTELAYRRWKCITHREDVLRPEYGERIQDDPLVQILLDTRRLLSLLKQPVNNSESLVRLV